MTRAFVYVTDEPGLELAQHSMVSVALSQRDPCDVHVFCYRFLPRASPDFVDAMAKLRADVIFHAVSDVAAEQHETCGHVTTPSLLKPAAVAKLTGQYDRIVYLDNDILVFDDLGIEGLDFGRTPIAAVTDMDLSDTGALRDSVWAGGGGKTDSLGGYFNVGVLVFESKNWRNGQFQGEYAAALDAHDVACPHKIDCTSIDQCALNSVFENNWTNLPLSYNLQASAKFTPAWQTAAVRHYCGRRKFIPVSPGRNDGRDVRYLNKVRRLLGRPAAGFPLFYELMFQLNCVRNYSHGVPIRRYMRAMQPDLAARGGRGRADSRLSLLAGPE